MNRQFLFVFLLLLSACAVRKDAPVSKPVVVQPVIKDTVIAVEEIKVPEKKIFKIQLLLALDAAHYLENDSLGNPINPDMEPLNQSALHLYEGMLLAASKGDSSIKVTVADAGSDSLKTLRLIKSKSNSDNDLVIAQLNSSFNAMAALSSTENNYSLIIPQHNTSALLTGNKNAWLATPSNKTQCRQMVSYVQLTQPNAVYRFIYREGTKKEVDLAELFYNEVLQLGADSSKCKKINYTKDGWNGVHKSIISGKKNVLFIPISDESVLSSLLKKLDTKDASDIMIVGLPTWEFMETMDFTLLETLNTYIFSTSYIDYENTKVKAFRKEFIESYHADPLPSAFYGFDFYNWIASNHDKHGSKIAEYESVPVLLSPTSGFRFRRVCENCGFENNYISVLKFQEGKLVKVNN